MDIVLGVSMGPTTVRLVVIEGQDADGVTVEQDEFEVAAAGNRAASGAVEQVLASIGGTREGAVEGGHRLTSTGVTWTDPADVSALRDALPSHGLGSVMLVSPLLAAAALAQTVGNALGYEHIAMLFVEPQSATLAVVDVADGSIVDLHRHQLAPATQGSTTAEMATMVAGLETRAYRANGVFLIGCGRDIVPIKPVLEAAISLEVTAPEEPDMALARGAALASGNAPLFASSTAALAYALDPGTGEVSPQALHPTYLDVAGNAASSSGALAYSAVEDQDDENPRGRRSRPMFLASSALAGIAAVVAGVVLVSLPSDRSTSPMQHNPPVSIDTPGKQLPAAEPSKPPAPQLAPPAPPASRPASPPQTAVAAPPSAAPPVEQPAPPPQVNPAPAAPVHRAPARSARDYVPPPVQQPAPAPAPAAPAPPPPAAPAPPPPAAPAPPPPAPRLPPMTMYLHLPFVTVPIPINPPPP